MLWYVCLLCVVVGGGSLSIISCLLYVCVVLLL